MEPRDRYRPATDHEVNQAVYRLSPTGTQEVADLVGVSKDVAERRLQLLEDRGSVWSKKVGPTKVWMHPWVMLEPGWEPDWIMERRRGRPSFGTRSESSKRRCWEWP